MPTQDTNFDETIGYQAAGAGITVEA